MQYNKIDFGNGQSTSDLLSSDDIRLLEAGILCLSYNLSHNTFRDSLVYKNGQEPSIDLIDLLEKVGIVTQPVSDDNAQELNIVSTMLVNQIEYSVVMTDSSVKFYIDGEDTTNYLSISVDYNEKCLKVIKCIDGESTTMIAEFPDEYKTGADKIDSSYLQDNDVQTLAAIINGSINNRSLLNLHLGAKYPHKKTDQAISFDYNVKVKSNKDELLLDDFLYHEKSNRLLGMLEMLDEELRPSITTDNLGNSHIINNLITL